MPSMSDLAVAITGTLAGVLLSRWRMNAAPMPRDEGVTSVQAIVAHVNASVRQSFDVVLDARDPGLEER